MHRLWLPASLLGTCICLRQNGDRIKLVSAYSQAVLPATSRGHRGQP